MTVNDHINFDLPTVKITDNALNVLDLYDEFKIGHLSVVDVDDRYLGLLEESNLLSVYDLDVELSKLPLVMNESTCLPHHHILDAISLAVKYKVSVVPVIQADGTFVGNLDHASMLFALEAYSAVRSIGSIIILRMKQNDYSISEIGRIVENTGYRLLSSMVTVDEDPTMMKLTLKLHQTHVSNIIAAFQRYNYLIEYYSYQFEEKSDEQQALDHFFKYLDT